MNALQVNKLSFAYGKKKVLNDLSFSINANDILCVLGPSGCGKTSLLRCLAGLESPQSGSIDLFGKQILNTKTGEFCAPHERNIGFVFHDGALFPHLNVEKNILFGVHSIKPTFYEDLLGWLKISDLKKSMPSQLSAGQAQRVALARSLVCTPKLLLLDEPFANLDVLLRSQFRNEIRQVLKDLKITAVFVTHDPLDAFEISDQVMLLKDGNIIQFGTPFDVYHKPHSKFVAEFFGSAQFINYKHTHQGEIVTELGTVSCMISPPSSEGQILVRPEDLVHDDRSPLKAKVISKQFKGSSFNYLLELPSGQKVLSIAPSHHNHSLGSLIGVRLEMDHVVILKN